jgi:hypothetical protein
VKEHGRYNQYGLMVGSVWAHLLRDLQREAEAEESNGVWAIAAAGIEEFMRERAEVWAKLRFPFGSEMPWDSTGQEEVYTWTKHFGFYNQSNATLAAVLSYMPAVPSWGYNGNARRYFDFAVYGGENFGTEREFMHYGAPLNAIVALDAFRTDPSDLHLLRIGIGGIAGSLTNINSTNGVASMGWHGSAEYMHRDPWSCGAYTTDYC